VYIQHERYETVSTMRGDWVSGNNLLEPDNEADPSDDMRDQESLVRISANGRQRCEEEK